MQLITILLVAVAILTLLTGISIMAGIDKRRRANGIWFFVSSIGTVVWSLSIATFLALSPTAAETAPAVVFLIYTGVILTDVALLGYICWQYSVGKFLTMVFMIAGILIAEALYRDPSIAYSSIALNRDGNLINLNFGWFFAILVVFFTLITFAFSGFLLYRIRHSRDRGIRVGNMIFLVGLSISGVVSLLFDLIQINPELVWLGPLVVSVVMLLFYYAILKYRIIKLSSFWLRTLSYIIIMTSAVIVYMALFFVVFTALFRVPSPSSAVILLNFVMILIVVLLMPVIAELGASVRSLISVGQVDTVYVIKKLNQLISRKVNLKELAKFLAEHLHFSYVGFSINGKIYGSSSLPLDLRALELVSTPKKSVEHGIWYSFSKSENEILEKQGIFAVAELRDAKGKAFGRILVGKSTAKKQFEYRDLSQLEMIINLIATVIDSSKKRSGA